jgi:hypothetical protein
MTHGCGCSMRKATWFLISKKLLFHLEWLSGKALNVIFVLELSMQNCRIVEIDEQPLKSQ